LGLSRTVLGLCLTVLGLCRAVLWLCRTVLGLSGAGLRLCRTCLVEIGTILRLVGLRSHLRLVGTRGLHLRAILRLRWACLGLTRTSRLHLRTVLVLAGSGWLDLGTVVGFT
jgi:hypothetical protein